MLAEFSRCLHHVEIFAIIQLTVDLRNSHKDVELGLENVDDMMITGANRHQLFYAPFAGRQNRRRSSNLCGRDLDR
jgi:hypothetical protein